MVNLIDFKRGSLNGIDDSESISVKLQQTILKIRNGMNTDRNHRLFYLS